MKLKLATRQYRAKATFEIESIVNGVIDGMAPEWEKLMAAILTALIEDFGNEIAEDLGGTSKAAPQSLPSVGGGVVGSGERRGLLEHKWTFDPFSAAVTAWIITNGAESVKSILDTDKADVRKVLLAGQAENLTTPQVARSLRQFYTDNNAYKAMRVARTETCKASSFGNLEAARQSQIVESKTWLTSRDDRVRDEHEAMDGETVGLNDIFSNGLEYPSEPNCRCVLTFKTGR